MGVNMTPSISGSPGLSEGYEVLSASLAKKQQLQDGRAALELLQSASLPAAELQAPTPVGNLGQNIDVHV